MKHNPKFGTAKRLNQRLGTVGWMQSTVKWMFEVLKYSTTALKRWILSTLLENIVGSCFSPTLLVIPNLIGYLL